MYDNCIICLQIKFLFLYLIGIKFRYALIGFVPEVYFDTTRGIINLTIYIDIVITIMSSFGTPASISFNFDTASVAENPT